MGEGLTNQYGTGRTWGNVSIKRKVKVPEPKKTTPSSGSGGTSQRSQPDVYTPEKALPVSKAEPSKATVQPKADVYTAEKALPVSRATKVTPTRSVSPKTIPTKADVYTPEKALPVSRAEDVKITRIKTTQDRARTTKEKELLGETISTKLKRTVPDPLPKIDVKDIVSRTYVQRPKEIEETITIQNKYTPPVKERPTTIYAGKTQFIGGKGITDVKEYQALQLEQEGFKGKVQAGQIRLESMLTKNVEKLPHNVRGVAMFGVGAAVGAGSLVTSFIANPVGETISFVKNIPTPILQPVKTINTLRTSIVTKGAPFVFGEIAGQVAVFNIVPKVATVINKGLNVVSNKGLLPKGKSATLRSPSKRKTTKTEYSKRTYQQAYDPRKFVTSSEIGMKIRSPELKLMGIKERVIRATPESRTVTDIGRSVKGGREALTTKFGKVQETSYINKPSISKPSKPSSSQSLTDVRRSAKYLDDVISGKNSPQQQQILIAKTSTAYDITKVRRTPTFKPENIIKKSGRQVTILKGEAPTQTKISPGVLDKPKVIRKGFRPGTYDKLMAKIDMKRAIIESERVAQQTPSIDMSELLGIKGLPKTNQAKTPTNIITTPTSKPPITQPVIESITRPVSSISPDFKVKGVIDFKTAMSRRSMLGVDTSLGVTQPYKYDTKMSQTQSSKLTNKTTTSQDTSLFPGFKTKSYTDVAQSVTQKQTQYLDQPQKLSTSPDLILKQSYPIISIPTPRIPTPKPPPPPTPPSPILSIINPTPIPPPPKPIPPPPTSKIKIPKIIEPIIPPPGSTKPLNKMITLGMTAKAYDVYVKRKLIKKGKKRVSAGYYKANTRKLDQMSAKGRLFQLLDKYANRTGYIKAASGSGQRIQNLVNKAKNMSYKFRQNKNNKNKFTEKITFAIDSPMEKRQIPYESVRLRKAGQIKMDKKKKKTKTKWL